MTVIFDFDGVLADSRAAIGGSITRALAAHGLPVPRDLGPLIGPPLLFSFAQALGTRPDDPRAQAVLDTYREHYVEVARAETTVFAGIPEAVAALAERHPLAVCTSKPKAYVEPLLDALALREHFGVVEGPALDAPGEEKTVTLGRLLAALGPGRAVMVGDREHDVIAAHAHRLPVIGVTWGFGAARELAAADAVVGTPAELPGTAARLLAA